MICICVQGCSLFTVKKSDFAFKVPHNMNACMFKCAEGLLPVC